MSYLWCRHKSITFVFLSPQVYMRRIDCLNAFEKLTNNRWSAALYHFTRHTQRYNICSEMNITTLSILLCVITFIFVRTIKKKSFLSFLSLSWFSSSVHPAASNAKQLVRVHIRVKSPTGDQQFSDVSLSLLRVLHLVVLFALHLRRVSLTYSGDCTLLGITRISDLKNKWDTHRVEERER